MTHPPGPQDWIYTSDFVGKQRTPKDDNALGHGTAVASKAVGRIFGVSKNTYLSPVKIKPRSDSLLEAFDLVVHDIALRAAKGAPTPAIIVCTLAPKLTQDIPKPSDWPNEPWISIGNYISELQIYKTRAMVVLSAGNGGRTVKKINTYPALLAEMSAPWSSNIIVAGSTTQRGVQSDFSKKRSQNGPMAWAIGEGVLCAGILNKQAVVAETGTSFAAPAVRFLPPNFLMGRNCNRY